ncbi:hypothetical protein LZ318_31905 [Saccharopolyspora indica]|uniref:hypothetical protein n=1 Tax=Saccharopolyspora indica TaxID=1229659 RepID=UPI0022EA5694|nr:hypothetical protein [Saccharopolyspora indica]MDA3644157.1 hypothetical protein [Saccharopolyspora indica]
MTYLNLVSAHIVPGGVSVPSVSVSVRGATYNLPAPQYTVDGPVVVYPFAEADEEGHSIRIRLDVWRAGCDLGHRFQSLPLNFPDMASAVDAARQFGRDPGIGWGAPREELEAWAMTFVEQERAQQGGDR